MIKALLALEWVVLLAAAAVLWQRAARRGKPHFARSLRSLGVALLLQFILFIAAEPIMSWGTAAGAWEDRLAGAAAALLLIQFMRSAALLVAAAGWLSIIRQIAPRRAVLVLALLLLHATLQLVLSDATFFAGLALLIILFRVDWTRAAPRGARVPITAGALVLLVQITWHWSVPGPEGDATIALSQTEMTITGAFPEAVQNLLRLATPWNVISRTVLIALVLQALAVVLRALVSFPMSLIPPLRLRGMSLERRLTVTYALVRIVPAIVLIAVIALGLPLALGMHKMVRLRAALRDEIVRAVPFAEGILEVMSMGSLAQDPQSSVVNLALARQEAGAGLAEAHVVIRQSPTVVEAYQADTSGVTPSPGHTTIPFLTSIATPGTPDALLERSPFTSLSADTLGGLIESEGALYIATTLVDRRYDSNPGTLVAETFVPVDSAFVNRLASELGVDLEIRTLPKTSIKRTATTLSISPADSAFAVPEIRVVSLGVSAGASRDVWHRPRYLGQATEALGDWLHLPISGAGVVVTLRASAAQIAQALGHGFFMLLDSSIGLPRIALALLLLGLAEVIAVRMGRGITRGLLEDVGTLTEAARRIGGGDLNHRVAVRGKDELASLARSFNAMAESLDAQRAELAEKERMEEDLAVAREIQSRFLPQGSPDVPWLDMAGASIPSREVGGDLFHFVTLDGGRIGLAIGDVSGKSIPAALLMFSALAALRAQMQFGADVDVTLTNVNRLLVSDVEPGRFVTFFYGVIDPSLAAIRYACAGHNPPLKLSAAGEAEWLGEAGVPLGILPDAEYRAAVAPLAPGDVLILYSDGITEAEGPGTRVVDGVEEPDLFGSERLLAAASALRGRSASEILDGIVEEVRRFAAGVPQSDDVTLVVARLTERGERATSPHPETTPR